MKKFAEIKGRKSYGPLSKKSGFESIDDIS